MSIEEPYRVVFHVTDGDEYRVQVRLHRGGDAEEAIDNLLAELQLDPGWRVESIWAALDDEIVTYSCRHIGNFRRGEPIPRKRDRAF